jgi:hypothetical protein
MVLRSVVERGSKMKRRLAYILILLILLTTVSICLPGCNNKELKEELTVMQVQKQFASSFDLFQKCADILWNRYDYFGHLFDETGYMRITSSSAIDHELYFSDAEWQVISDLFEKYNLKLIERDPMAIPSIDCIAVTLRFSFRVQPEEKHGGSYFLYYVRTDGSTDTFNIAQAIELFEYYVKQYGKLNKLSYDNWYEWFSDPE